jgi:transposase-like protein
MSGTRFSADQITELQSLPIIARASPKMLVFSQQFKRFAIEQAKNGKSIYSIVKEAGIDTALFKGNYLYTQLKSWRKQDLDSPPKTKGRPKVPPTLNNSDLSKEQLLSKLALLEAENSFLKKVRAPKTYLSGTDTDLSLGRSNKD